MAKVKILKAAEYNAQSSPNIEVNKTLKPVDRELSTIEAEAGEVIVMSDHTGLPTQFTVGGKSHSQGGTPLNAPPESFIFSKDKQLKIKDPTILKLFNMGGKSSYAPADIAKQYDINEYRKVLADPNADKMQKETAEMMIANYNEKLGKLGIVQESMKGFPQGIPKIAMPYLAASGFDPASIFSPTGDEMPTDMNQAQYGGPIPEMYPARMQMGGPANGITNQDAVNYFFQDGGQNTTTRRYSTGNPSLDAQIDQLYKTGKWDEDSINSIIEKSKALGINTGSSFLNPAGADGVFADIKYKGSKYNEAVQKNLTQGKSTKALEDVKKNYTSTLDTSGFKKDDISKFNNLKSSYINSPSKYDNSPQYYDLKHFVEKTQAGIEKQKEIAQSKDLYVKRYSELQDAQKRLKYASDHTKNYTPDELDILHEQTKVANRDFWQLQRAVENNYSPEQLKEFDKQATKGYKQFSGSTQVKPVTSVQVKPQQIVNTSPTQTPPSPEQTTNTAETERLKQSVLGTGSKGAPAVKPDFSKMSDDELKAFLNQ